MNIAFQEVLSLPRRQPSKLHASFIQYLTLRDVDQHRGRLLDMLDEVEARIGRRRAQDGKKVRDCARLILANLVFCTYNRHWLAVPGKKELFGKGSHLHDNLFLSYQATQDTLDTMIHMGWLNPKIPGNSFEGRANLYAPTMKLEEVLSDWLYVVEKPFSAPYLFQSWEEGTGKKEKRMREPIVGLPEDHADVARLVEINEFLSQQSFALKGPLHMIYRRDKAPYFVHGGRLYTNIQSLPARRAKVRVNTKINDQPVVEIDLKANHLRIAAAMSKEQIPDDPYIDIADRLGLSRDQVKLVINRSIGSTNAARSEYGMTHPDDVDVLVSRAEIKAIRGEAERVYPFVSFDKGLGLQLQSIEGQIMLATLIELKRAGIVALPIHDALMVQDTMFTATIAEATLKTVWCSYLGVSFKPTTTLGRGSLSTL